MPRPVKYRRVLSVPGTTLFGPLGIDNQDMDTIVMTIEELESIRLMDMEGLDQIGCAESMGVARSTFQRIYSEAKRKVADSIVNGKILKIQGGNYTLNLCSIACRYCGYTWQEKYEDIKDHIRCPKCHGDAEAYCIQEKDTPICQNCRWQRRRRGHGHFPG